MEKLDAVQVQERIHSYDNAGPPAGYPSTFILLVLEQDWPAPSPPRMLIIAARWVQSCFTQATLTSTELDPHHITLPRMGRFTSVGRTIGGHSIGRIADSGIFADCDLSFVAMDFEKALCGTMDMPAGDIWTKGKIAVCTLTGTMVRVTTAMKFHIWIPVSSPAHPRINVSESDGPHPLWISPYGRKI